MQKQTKRSVRSARRRTPWNSVWEATQIKLKAQMADLSLPKPRVKPAPTPIVPTAQYDRDAFDAAAEAEGAAIANKRRDTPRNSRRYTED